MNPCSAGNPCVSSRHALPVSLPVATAGLCNTLWAADADFGAHSSPSTKRMANDRSNDQWPAQCMLTIGTCGDAVVWSFQCLGLLAALLLRLRLRYRQWSLPAGCPVDHDDHLFAFV